jgi:hypothetical protein
MTQIEITFEKGGSFVANLLEKEAPQTCREFLAHLPVTLTFQHSTTSGQAVVGFPKDILVTPENQRTLAIYPGSLCFLVRNPAMHVPYEIYITYGPYFLSRGFRVDYQEPVNVFGQIESGLETLASTGERILKKGVERVTFKVIES